MRIERLELFHVSVPLPATQRLGVASRSQPAGQRAHLRADDDRRRRRRREPVASRSAASTPASATPGAPSSSAATPPTSKASSTCSKRAPRSACASRGSSRRCGTSSARSAGLPVYRLLGGVAQRACRPTAPPPRSGARGARREPARAQGGRLPRREAARAQRRLARRHAHHRAGARRGRPDFKLLVDANQGFYWGMSPAARRSGT